MIIKLRGHCPFAVSGLGLALHIIHRSVDRQHRRAVLPHRKAGIRILGLRLGQEKAAVLAVLPLTVLAHIHLAEIGKAIIQKGGRIQKLGRCLLVHHHADEHHAVPLGEGHQTIQSLYAIASGGLAGLGLGNSRQKYLYVPEPQNDFIFSILCEELGFIGAALVVALFLLLLLRGMSIAVRARDKFGALLVVGFVVQVTLQAILNMAVVTNTIPNTGISLPFFSSGGTSLLMLLGEMGIVLSVSRQTDMV